MADTITNAIYEQNKRRLEALINQKNALNSEKKEFMPKLFGYAKDLYYGSDGHRTMTDSEVMELIEGKADSRFQTKYESDNQESKSEYNTLLNRYTEGEKRLAEIEKEQAELEALINEFEAGVVAEPSQIKAEEPKVEEVKAEASEKNPEGNKSEQASKSVQEGPAVADPKVVTSDKEEPKQTTTYSESATTTPKKHKFARVLGFVIGAGIVCALIPFLVSGLISTIAMALGASLVETTIGASVLGALAGGFVGYFSERGLEAVASSRSNSSNQRTNAKEKASPENQFDYQRTSSNNSVVENDNNGKEKRKSVVDRVNDVLSEKASEKERKKLEKAQEKARKKAEKASKKANKHKSSEILMDSQTETGEVSPSVSSGEKVNLRKLEKEEGKLTAELNDLMPNLMGYAKDLYYGNDNHRSLSDSDVIDLIEGNGAGRFQPKYESDNQASRKKYNSMLERYKTIKKRLAEIEKQKENAPEEENSDGKKTPEWLNKFKNDASDAVKTATASALGAMTEAKESIKNNFENAKEKVQESAKEFGTKVKNGAQKIKERGEEALQSAKANVQNATASMLISANMLMNKPGATRDKVESAEIELGEQDYFEMPQEKPQVEPEKREPKYIPAEPQKPDEHLERVEKKALETTENVDEVLGLTVKAFSNFYQKDQSEITIDDRKELYLAKDTVNEYIEIIKRNDENASTSKYDDKKKEKFIRSLASLESPEGLRDIEKLAKSNGACIHMLEIMRDGYYTRKNADGSIKICDFNDNPLVPIAISQVLFEAIEIREAEKQKASQTSQQENTTQANSSQNGLQNL